MTNIQTLETINYLNKVTERTKKIISQYERWTISELKKRRSNKNKLEHYNYNKKLQQKMLIADLLELTRLQDLLINETK